MILNPQKLRQTYCSYRPFKLPIMHGNEVEEGDIVDWFDTNQGQGLADGGLISTAQDINRFLKKLFSEGSVISANSLKLMKSSVKDYGYGMGVEVQKKQGVEVLGHLGTLKGHRTHAYYLPQFNSTLVIATNITDSDLSVQEKYEIIVTNLLHRILDILQKEYKDRPYKFRVR